MMMRHGFGVPFMMLVVWLVPLLMAGWFLVLMHRAVRALESIAQPSRENKQTP